VDFIVQFYANNQSIPTLKFKKNSNPNYQWVKLEKDFFGFKTDLFICCVYDPASNSSYSKELEKEIEHFQKRGNVFKVTKCVTKNSTINKSQLVTDTKIYEIFTP
jgi:hypothetical protein